MDRGVQFFDCNIQIGHSTVPRQDQVLQVDELISEMDRCGIEWGLVHHALASEWSPVEGNQVLVELLAEQPRLFPCFVGLPSATHEVADPGRLASEARAHNGAVKLFPKDHSFGLADWCAGDLMEALSAQRVPAIIHFGQIDWSQLAQLLSDHPQLPIILLGSGYRVDRYLYPLWSKHDNLYLEVATYQTFRGIEAVCERFGPRRLVFGTGMPQFGCGGVVSAITYADIPDQQKRDIASGNMRRILGIEQAPHEF